MLTVARRELLIGLRRGTPFALLATNAALLALLALAVGAISGMVSPWIAPPIGATSTATPSGIVATLVAWRGAALFLLLSFWVTIAAGFMAPLAGARAILDERRRGTLSMLIGTGVGAQSVVLGKAIGSATPIGLILFSSLPAFALSWLFGGVSPRIVAVTLSVIVGFTVLSLALGMLLATVLTGETAAIVAAVGLSLFGTVVPTIAFAIGGLTGFSATTRYLAPFSPVVTLLAANPELTEALARTAGSGLLPPLQFGVPIGAYILVMPVALLTGAAYALVGLACLPIIAGILDPYHRLKTMHLRGRAGAHA
jgi:hypothetical protein